jgi:hypothetical protein
LLDYDLGESFRRTRRAAESRDVGCVGNRERGVIFIRLKLNQLTTGVSYVVCYNNTGRRSSASSAASTRMY